MSHGGDKSKKTPGKGIDFLATGFKVTTNCAFSVKIMENFKIQSDHLLSGTGAPAYPMLANAISPTTADSRERSAYLSPATPAPLLINLCLRSFMVSKDVALR